MHSPGAAMSDLAAKARELADASEAATSIAGEPRPLDFVNAEPYDEEAFAAGMRALTLHNAAMREHEDWHNPATMADIRATLRALAEENERMHPVVEAARAFVALYPHSTPSLAPEWTALRAALEAHDA